jgi:D-alanine-D-alanine ligase-like ATP-grasp enzyme
MYEKHSLINEIAQQVASEHGLQLILEPEFGFVGQFTTSDGRKKYFRSGNFDLNSLGASEIARDKGYAAFFMRQMGYQIPTHQTFFSDKFAKVLQSSRTAANAPAYAAQLGYPVIVKPNSLSQGVGIEKVHNAAQLIAALERIFTQHRERVALVEKYYIGDDYRLVIVDQQLISAYRRVPLTIIGDGQHTIRQLLELRQADFLARDRDTVLKPDDPRIAQKLQRDYEMNLSSVPPSEQQIQLLDIANLSAGGEAIDVTYVIHPTYIDLAVRLTRDMGLRLAGVDILTQGPIDEPLSPHHLILEINAAPGLDHYAQIGEQQLQIVRAMYKQVVLAMAS